MAEFFKTSTIWVIDFRYEGRARRWFRAFGQKDDVPQLMRDLLRDLYGERAQLVEARKATEEEELQYLARRGTKERLLPDWPVRTARSRTLKWASSPRRSSCFGSSACDESWNCWRAGSADESMRRRGPRPCRSMPATTGAGARLLRAPRLP